MNSSSITDSTMAKKPGKNKTQRASKGYDNDTVIFISMAQEHKDEGTKLFQKKDYEGAISKFEKARLLLPKNHIDIAYLRTSVAECYMQMGINEFPKAIEECNLALEVTPKYSKALLKRARCYEALNKLELALKDVKIVLEMEPKNLMAMEIFDRVKTLTVAGDGRNATKNSGFSIREEVKGPTPAKEKSRKKKSKKLDEKKATGDGAGAGKVEFELQAVDNGGSEEKETKDKLVIEEKISEEHKRSIKLVYGDDIRWAKIPYNCDVLELREVIFHRFPVTRAVLMKYRDPEGDMITVTTNEELRWAESIETGSVKLHIFDVDPEQDPFYDHIRRQERLQKLSNSTIDEWILEFAELFKNHVGVNSDGVLDLYEVGMNLYTDAMDDAITSSEAQTLFDNASKKFQEMAALALFNCGNVHMSRARKRTVSSGDNVVTELKDSYSWARNEYAKAGERYEEAVRIKPDFYEGRLGLGYQQFEQAKLSWWYAVKMEVDLEKWDSTEVMELYNRAEENVEKGMEMWEEMEEKRDENMKALMNVLWGRMLYERSSMEFKLGLPFWHECLEVAVEKFEVAGVSVTDMAVVVKNHCSNDAAPQGLGFDIDEIVQAWHEMYEVKRWQSGIPSFRLQPLLQRRVSKLFYASEHPR